jgi:hypothetical protein
VAITFSYAEFPLSDYGASERKAITKGRSAAEFRNCAGSHRRRRCDSQLGVDLLERLVDRPWAETENLCAVAPVSVAAAAEFRLTRPRISKPARTRCH